DHNTITHNLEFAAQQTDDLLLIPAEEVTTYYGHLNVWGIRDWVDFRARSADDMQRIVQSAHARGYLTSVNHPKPDGPPWEYGDDVDFDCIEVWQAPWAFHNQVAYDWWDSLLRQGRRVIAVGGSDYHQPAEAMQGNPHLLGQPTTWVYADELSAAAILDAIRHGRVFISADVNGPHLVVSATTSTASYQTGDVVAQGEPLEVSCAVRGAAGHWIRMIADGALMHEAKVEQDDWTQTFTVRDARTYVRVELVERTQIFGHEQWLISALSNPFFIRKP
ncbi:MAG: CehA/McbA family metallohydrolase, partial [Chloroflexi bacterium]|nr:CehA/McbA family metallohydrolase [Chloroflexota bacterium]